MTPFLASARMRSTEKGGGGEEEEEEEEGEDVTEEGMLWYARITSTKAETSLSKMETWVKFLSNISLETTDREEEAVAKKLFGRLFNALDEGLFKQQPERLPVRAETEKLNPHGEPSKAKLMY